MPDKKVEQLKEEICSLQANLKNDSSSPTIRADFSRYKQTNFMELLKAHEEAVCCHQSPELDERLHDEFELTTKTEKHTKMLQLRQRLPSFQDKEEIVDLVKRNKVVLIAGKTGCGKTTQVAQYILDDAIKNMKGSETKIICTQPRRIAGRTDFLVDDCPLII